MRSNYERFKAFYQTSSFWQGSLAGITQFSLAQFNFDHLRDSGMNLELPRIPMGTVLGKRAEYFFKFCVEQSSNYDLITSNLQIFQGQRTIGELDYVMRRQSSQQVYHVELVYKFYIIEDGHAYHSKYLSVNQNKELQQFVGPNRRDYFIKKLDHLKNHQLPLLYRQETIEALSQFNVDVQKVKQLVCFLAHVFVSRDRWRDDYQYLNKSCIVGYYMEEHAFAKAETSNIYFLPEKYAWKMQPEPLQEGYIYAEIVKRVSESLQRGFAPLLWMQLESGAFERFFVVANRT
jgi:hypothetical protein